LTRCPFSNFKSKHPLGHAPFATKLSALKPLRLTSRLSDLYETCKRLIVSDFSYINDILQNTPSSVDQVTIEPNGEFHTTNGNTSPKRTRDQANSGEDDELVEIRQGPRFSAVKGEVDSVSHTPAEPSREHSVVAPYGGSKRSISQVIDLTFSSDEDEPPRAPKRRPTQSSSMSLSRYPSSGENPNKLERHGSGVIQTDAG
jgi:hypothetical protein